MIYHIRKKEIYKLINKKEIYKLINKENNNNNKIKISKK
jgi:hypothetical protein